MKKLMLLAIGALAASAALALPKLKPQAELVANGQMKMRVIANAEGIPPPTPEAQIEVRTVDGKEERRRVFDEKEVAFAKELLGQWKDRKGNVMRLAKPAKYPWGEGVDYKTTKTLKGENYYIDFVFAEPVTPAQAAKLLKDAAGSLSTSTGGVSANNSSMKWWTSENEQYSFLTDLDKSKGSKFIKDAMRLMAAMRKSYEHYVPPQEKVKKCVVRVFKTMQGYRDYRASTGDGESFSCGLWDPNREELLIAAEDRDEAQSTMRHEAFHQYLHFATDNGNHAIWFNEGHACFFENIKYNPAKNTVKIVEECGRSQGVAEDPEKHAKHMKEILKMNHDAFISGDVHLNYRTAWALMYFLERGAYTLDEFAPYRKIVPTYLKLTGEGMDAAEATTKAWEAVKDRDLEADFLKFWKEKRKAALTAREALGN